jgi:glycosyltransferase involved in cell wall biosynthesis
VVAKYIFAALLEQNEVTHYTMSPPSFWKMSEIIELWWGNPVDWEWSDNDVAMRAGICLSEARSLLASNRDKVLENVSKCDVIICPGIHAAQAYMEAPFDVPIHIVPFGIDPKEFPYVERNWDDRLSFLHMGRTQFRKGSWRVPDAFIRTMNKAQNARLTIACMDNPTDMFIQMKREYSGHPRINFYDGFKESAMEYYKGHHIIVSPHLAEGWGLCIAEALATGMAGIVARCSTPLEYFQKDYGWWIEMSEHYAPVRNCLGNTGGQWRLPDVDSLANAMLEAYENRERCRQAGIVASETFHNRFTWADTASDLCEVLYDYMG